MPTTTMKPPVSPTEYLVRERAAEYRSEYVDGEVCMMTGASRKHSLVTLNVGRSLADQLRGRPCETYLNDMRVKVARTGAYVYPDVLVSCGSAEVEDEHDDTLLNPTLLVEVLSPSTEAFDRGRKWEHYRRLPTLMDYLLVAQDRPRVERYTREGDGLWLFSETNGLDGVVSIDSVGCTLALRDVYERVL